MLTSAEVEAVETKAAAMLSDPACTMNKTKVSRFLVHCVEMRTMLINQEGRARIAASTPAKPAVDKF
jgi:hypothetical protein